LSFFRAQGHSFGRLLFTGLSCAWFPFLPWGCPVDQAQHPPTCLSLTTFLPPVREAKSVTWLSFYFRVLSSRVFFIASQTFFCLSSLGADNSGFFFFLILFQKIPVHDLYYHCLRRATSPQGSPVVDLGQSRMYPRACVGSNPIVLFFLCSQSA